MFNQTVQNGGPNKTSRTHGQNNQKTNPLIKFKFNKRIFELVLVMLKVVFERTAH